MCYYNDLDDQLKIEPLLHYIHLQRFRAVSVHGVKINLRKQELLGDQKTTTRKCCLLPRLFY